MSYSIIGSYTSYFRSLVEPCGVDVEKADSRNMEILRLNRLEVLLHTLAGKILRKI